MAHTKQHIEAEIGSQEAFEQMVKERLQYAVRVALMSVLEEEVTAMIGAQPYERTKPRRDQRNGHYTRHAGNDGGADCGFARSAHTWWLSDPVVRALPSSSRRTG
jgi:transposase-like protein